LISASINVRGAAEPERGRRSSLRITVFDAATHIRRLFLEPKESYSIRDAAEILCMPLPDVLGWMEVGELEGWTRLTA
jgi:hypothetical protein